MDCLDGLPQPAVLNPRRQQLPVEELDQCISICSSARGEEEASSVARRMLRALKHGSAAEGNEMEWK